MSSSRASKPWTFVTNHTQVLLCISRDGDMRIRDIAERVRITERAAQRIVADLVEAGYVERRKVGRRNHYSIDRRAKMRDPAQGNKDVGELLDLLGPTGSGQNSNQNEALSRRDALGGTLRRPRLRP